MDRHPQTSYRSPQSWDSATAAINQALGKKENNQTEKKKAAIDTDLDFPHNVTNLVFYCVGKTTKKLSSSFLLCPVLLEWMYYKVTRVDFAQRFELPDNPHFHPPSFLPLSVECRNHLQRTWKLRRNHQNLNTQVHIRRKFQANWWFRLALLHWHDTKENTQRRFWRFDLGLERRRRRGDPGVKSFLALLRCI